MIRSRTTRSAPRGTLRRRLAAAVVAIVGVLAVDIAVDVAVGTPSASAHGAVEATTPRAGEHLASPPVDVRIEFTSRLRGGEGAIVVEDSSGRKWAVGRVRVDAMSLSRAVDPRLPDGDYQARWNAVAADGAPLHGVLRFTVGRAGDSDPFSAVVTADGVAWFRGVSFAFVGAVIALVGYLLLTTYGRPRSVEGANVGNRDHGSRADPGPR